MIIRLGYIYMPELDWFFIRRGHSGQRTAAHQDRRQFGAMKTRHMDYDQYCGRYFPWQSGDQFPESLHPTCGCSHHDDVVRHKINDPWFHGRVTNMQAARPRSCDWITANVRYFKPNSEVSRTYSPCGCWVESLGLVRA